MPWVYVCGWVLLVGLSIWAVPVHFDEAQYATWLAFPDLSYQTKGPLVTWSQSLTHGLGLPLIVETRIPAWIAWLGAGAVLQWLGRLIGLSADARLKLAVLFVSSPMLLALGAVHTTDIWLLFFICLALAAMAKIVAARAGESVEIWWVVMGAALGVGALAKLSIALIPLSILPWVLVRAPRLLFTPGPYLGALFCALAMSPWIVWNLDHEFSHFRHEFGHVNSETDSPWHAVDWIVSVLVAAMPVALFGLFGGLRWRVDHYVSDGESAAREMLRSSFTLLVLFFLVKGFFGEILVNWTLPLLPVLLLLMAGRLKWSTRGVVTAGVIQGLVFVLLLFPYGVGLSRAQDAFQKIRGWDTAMARAAELAGPTEVLSAGHYSILAWALYHWPTDATGIARYQRPLGQVIPDAGRRLNQYDRWAVLESSHDRVIHLGAYSEAMAQRCSQFRRLGEVPQVMPDGTIRSELPVYECLGFRPNPPWPVVTRH